MPRLVVSSEPSPGNRYLAGTVDEWDMIPCQNTEILSLIRPLKLTTIIHTDDGMVPSNNDDGEERTTWTPIMQLPCEYVYQTRSLLPFC